MNCFCTIITASYYYYVKTLYDSLAQFNQDVQFKLLVVDGFETLKSYKNISFYSLEDVKIENPSDYALIEKYEVDIFCALRWALKPLFLKHLLKNESFEKAIFLDADLYFFEDPQFLLNQLDDKDVLLTPHWRSKQPFIDAVNFKTLFDGGIYNAGFFASNRHAINVLDWWIQACSFRMQEENGLYYDQAYLNLMPVYFNEQVGQVSHRGCNVANWNMVENVRVPKGNQVFINGVDPIVFIHFTKSTITGILNGADANLIGYLKEYENALIIHEPGFKFKLAIKNEQVVKSTTIEQKLKAVIKKIVKKIKR